MADTNARSESERLAYLKAMGIDVWQRRDLEPAPEESVESAATVLQAAGSWDDLPGKWVAKAGLSTEPVKVLAAPANVFGQKEVWIQNNVSPDLVETSRFTEADLLNLFQRPKRKRSGEPKPNIRDCVPKKRR